MPRAFDSDEIARSDGMALRFTEIVECRVCQTEFEGAFCDPAGSMTVEDMTDPPVGQHCCPACGYRWDSEMTGWSLFSEAG